MTLQARIILSLAVIVLAIGGCLPIWFSLTKSPVDGYIMATAGLLLAVIFLIPRRRNG